MTNGQVKKMTLKSSQWIDGSKEKGKQKQHEHNSGTGSFQVERTDAIKTKEIKLTDQFALLGFVGF